MGKGIAFQKKKREEVDVSQIEKTFILKNEKLSACLDDHLYVALTDHLSFALKRHQKGIYLPNNLLYEVRKYYKDEFRVGMKSLDIIENYTGVRFQEDEAASIAMHLV